MEELKKCPFCGGRAIVVQTTYGTRDGSACLGFEIRCVRCLAKAPSSHGVVLVKLDDNGELRIWKDDRIEAMAAWNRRADDGQETQGAAG